MVGTVGKIFAFCIQPQGFGFVPSSNSRMQFYFFGNSLNTHCNFYENVCCAQMFVFLIRRLARPTFLTIARQVVRQFPQCNFSL